SRPGSGGTLRHPQYSNAADHASGQGSCPAQRRAAAGGIPALGRWQSAEGIRLAIQGRSGACQQFQLTGRGFATGVGIELARQISQRGGKVGGYLALQAIKPMAAEDSCIRRSARRSEEHTSELQSRENLVCRLLLE